MRDVNYKIVAEKYISHLEDGGVFLMAKSAEKTNIMTIGWANIGRIWTKPIVMVAVKKSRFTFDIIDKANSFNINIPITNMREALIFCGTKSGRDFDKFKECNLTLIPAQKVETPIVNISGYHCECKIVHKSVMNPVYLSEEYRKTYYSDEEYHILYFGEILACYINE